MNYQEQRKLAAKIFPDESDFIMDDGNCFDKIVARVAESGRLADRLSRLRQLVNDATVEAEWSACALRWTPVERLTETQVQQLVDGVAVEARWAARVLRWTPVERLTEAQIQRLQGVVK